MSKLQEITLKFQKKKSNYKQTNKKKQTCETKSRTINYEITNVFIK